MSEKLTAGIRELSREECVRIFHVERLSDILKKQRMLIGIERYRSIMERVWMVDVSSDEVFQKTYENFYTLDPEQPIWDRNVTERHFGYKIPANGTKNREKKMLDRYEQYKSDYLIYMDSPDGKAVIRAFEWCLGRHTYSVG